MRLWIDDTRPAPIGYIWCKSVNEAIERIEDSEIRVGMLDHNNPLCEEDIKELSIELIDLDCDYANDGRDYILLLDWLEETERNYPIRVHSISPKSELEICAHYSAEQMDGGNVMEKIKEWEAL